MHNRGRMVLVQSPEGSCFDKPPGGGPYGKPEGQHMNAVAYVPHTRQQDPLDRMTCG